MDSLELIEDVTYATVDNHASHHHTILLALNPGFPFQTFLQSCETKSGRETLVWSCNMVALFIASLITRNMYTVSHCRVLLSASFISTVHSADALESFLMKKYEPELLSILMQDCPSSHYALNVK